MRFIKEYSLVAVALAIVLAITYKPAWANYPAEPIDPTSASIVTFEWDQPYQRVDGSTLFPSEIGGYRIYERGELILSIDEGDILSAVYDYGGYGEGCWSISTVDTWGQEGPQSEEMCGTVKPPAPGAPSLTISFGA